MKNAKETIRGALADVDNMGLITREIHSFLQQKGYSLIEARKLERSGWNKDLTVNSLEYLYGERERVFITTHEVEGDIAHGKA